MKRYIVLCQQVVGGPNTPWEIVYNFDHEYFRTREQAIKHGWVFRGSDDFNVAAVENGRVAALYWMDEDMSNVHDLKAINEQISVSTGDQHEHG